MQVGYIKHIVRVILLFIYVKNDGVRNFDVSDNGRHIVFESKTGLYTLDLTTLSLQSLPLEVSRDQRHYEIERKTFTDNVKEFAVSPGGGYITFVINGEFLSNGIIPGVNGP